MPEVAEVTQRGRQSQVKYRGIEVLLDMPAGDARQWAATFEDKVNTMNRQELYRWLGGHSAVRPESREAVLDGDLPVTPQSQDQVMQAAIEHTDPAWRYLGVDETAGDPDLRTFDKTDAGFVRHSEAKSPGLPADPEPVTDQEPPKSPDELREIATERGMPEPGDTKIALDPQPGKPIN